MKINLHGDARIIMSNPYSKHEYFGWPSIARLQNGKIAVVASGFRLSHICPFGKTVISYSEDEGKTYTLPAPVIDTVLDDRDAGIVTFGERGVIVTSFNNTLQFQKDFLKKSHWVGTLLENSFQWSKEYSTGYLNSITEEEQNEVLGSTFRISNDCGVSFGKIFKSPITSPHGPCITPDGKIIWVGRTFVKDKFHLVEDCISAYTINTDDGSMEYLGSIEEIELDGEKMLSCEPHAIVLDDGTIITHIRVQCKNPKVFTIYQSVSTDGGTSWSKPEILIDRLGGSPPHLYKHSSGALICTYAQREAPFTVKAMFSFDNAKTWDTDHELYVNGVDEDLGYPSTVELEDGSLITVFYAHPSKTEPAVIMQQQWSFEK